VDCSVLVTGHNLDDVAQTILMNIMNADVKRFSRMGPHLDPVQGLVPRAMILRTTPETETYLAAHLMDIPIHDTECPYAVRAQRGSFRDVILKMEMETPGTRHSLLRFHEQVSNCLESSIERSQRCSICGDMMVSPEDEPICNVCKLLGDLGASL
jgi:uncharacterized protein (TIGR00269 family)